MRVLSLWVVYCLISLALCCPEHNHPLVKRKQDDSPDAPNAQIRPLTWGEINFLHTTDIHGWIEGHLKEGQYSADFGDVYSFVSQMKNKAWAEGRDLLVIDSGDLHGMS